MGSWADAIAVERAFSCAVVAARPRRRPSATRRRRGSASSSTSRLRWPGIAGRAARRSARRSCACASRPESLDVVVTEAHLLDGLVDAASHFAGSKASSRTAGCPRAAPASSRRAERGRRPRRLRRRRPDGDAPDRVAAARRRAEAPLRRDAHAGRGLKRRAASRTLERASARRPRAAETHDTRSFTDAVIALHAAGAHRCRALRRGLALSRGGCSAPTRSCGASSSKGSTSCFGIPGGAILPLYDAIRARDDRAARARAARAGRGPHGRGLRARLGQGRRRDRDLRPGRDEPRDADRRRVDGLDAARLHHRPGALVADRHRRVPGDRRDRASRCRSSSTPGSSRTSRSCPACSRPRSTSRARAARARCSSTSRRTSRRPSSTSFTPTRSTCPGGSRRQGASQAAAGSCAARSPWRSGRSSTRAAASSTPTPATSCSSSSTRRSFPQS